MKLKAIRLIDYLNNPSIINKLSLAFIRNINKQTWDKGAS